MNYLITNLVYGKTYAKIYLNAHLKSALDESNLHSIVDEYETSYILYTDNETKPVIESHPNWISLSSLIQTKIVVFNENILNYNNRYDHLGTMLRDSIKNALSSNSLLTACVADWVFAKNFFPRTLKKISEGYDSVFVLPMRGASEIMLPSLSNKLGALEDLDLFKLCYVCLHPLWVACHWDAPQFSRIPYCLIWNSHTGLVVRSFSHTPIVIKVYPEMVNASMLDVDLPGFSKNIFWAKDWTDAPVIGCEPLECFYPAFANIESSAPFIGREWCKNLHPTTIPYLNKTLYYPNKKIVNASSELLDKSNQIINRIYYEWTKTKAKVS